MKSLETIFCTLGFLLLSAFVAATGWGELERRQGLAAFTGARLVAAHTGTSAVQAVEPRSVAALTAPAAVNAPKPAATLAATADGTLAVLRIPAIKLEVPVRLGTQGDVLLRGAGLVEGSPLPNSNGNIAIAAHRDGWFRGLRDIEIGDPIVLATLDGERTYRVTALTVVQPHEVGVLADVGSPVITLVTCFPFQFVGRAPQRFIVRAVADATST